MSSAELDVSVVVPTHNGAARLGETLRLIAAQEAPAGLSWEVVLLDNGSTDDTAGTARAAWPADAPVPLRIVREDRLGLSFAHVRGFDEARGEVVTWVEDDNRIAPDWVKIVSEVMAAHPQVGAFGGFNEPDPETPPPDWFAGLQGAYACGPQGPAAGGDVTEERGYLWGAGLTVRREAWRHLIENGWSPLLMDRRGSGSYLSGGDAEICLALQLSGWRLWFEPRLRLRHFLLEHRLDWAYLRRLQRGAGGSTVGLDPYQRALGRQGLRDWRGEAGHAALEIARRRRIAWRSWRGQLEGYWDVLELEQRIGRLQALLRLRGRYDDNLRAIETAPWRR